MSEILCGYTGDRHAALMEYLYGEMTPDDRMAFDAHLSSCARCRTELSAFGGVRRQMARWSPPDFASITQRADENETAAHGAVHRVWWWDIPAWAQVAAAMLVVGVAAGVANLDVHYDAQNGLSVRTGWSQPTRQADVASPSNLPNLANPTNPAISNPWRADLTALEQQLRNEMHAAQAVGSAGARGSSSNDAELMRRTKALVDDSERRQQRELALRVTALIQDLNAQRQADLRRIDQNLGLIQDRTGVEVLKNRQMIDYYMQRVSQRP
jgi:putative zinc finger protein